MATFSITCPNCEKVLKTKSRPPEGKKVKCPGCESAFVPEDIEEEDDEGIQEKPSNKSGTAMTDKEGKPKKKSKSGNGDDEDLPSIKKKKKKEKSSMMLYLIIGGVVLAGGGACLCCGGLTAIGLWVWPGWLLKSNDLIGYASTDANLLVGGNLKAMNDRSMPLTKKGAKKPGWMDKWPAEADEVINNSDNFLVFGNTNTNNPPLVVIKSTAEAIAKLKKNPALGAAQTLGGHADVYKPKERGWPPVVAFPTDRIFILGWGTDQELTAALDRGKKAATPGAAAELSKTVSSSHLWMVYTFTPKNRTDFKQGMAGMKRMGDKIKGTQDVASALEGAKGLTLTMDVTSTQDLKMVATMVCKNSEDAAKASKGLDEAWNSAKAEIGKFAGAGPLPGGNEKAVKAMMGDLNSMKFQAQGSNATVTLQFSSATMRELEMVGEKQMMMFP